jgi:hypothetical protein
MACAFPSQVHGTPLSARPKNAAVNVKIAPAPRDDRRLGDPRHVVPVRRAGEEVAKLVAHRGATFGVATKEAKAVRISSPLLWVFAVLLHIAALVLPRRG